ncbi:thiol peroxidase [Treponema phagedenis]|uniref:Putative thiol peroxidase n=1 Tax=Treponema phagedenis TaxID=162 RepID=A0A0B7GPX4_TREPH|nr:thiol peroxidase [Treponema phagedenis]NVP23371.1 thiol peroxidase [Treponema phagedenis]QEJ95593.1 thiol peroxidase [Treponema phagedenis]QEK01445.1 thiol peroxidase [Treponema phagedenis]QEK06465.1 thiol peroxidase [Treponema phagedenis]QKS92810.1 thiol peroxidase [Treponema phagedenis]
MNITMAGNPVSLTGTLVKVGDKAPDFLVKNKELGNVALKDTKGLRLFVAVPSLDTPVCDMEVRKFHKEAAAVPQVETIVLSMDLPFAQARWCGAAGIDTLTIYSDFYNHSFGKNYGLYISELGLLARAIIIVDAANTVRYVQVVPEVTHEPDYADVIKALKALA